ncbi:hypothetical protein BC829DRAFT_63446 [Chytridium lagenaria]|nr:hypothetical protein BC829DRAFT_63446 [Chytridium lagenaria]
MGYRRPRYPQPSLLRHLPYFTRTRTTTLILEYMQGINGVRYTFPAGGFDPRKHATREDTARDELSEEARLKGGKLVSLLPEGSEGIMEVKWCRNKFLPFVVVDPVLDVNPRERDAEEMITIVSDVTIKELEAIMLRGN